MDKEQEVESDRTATPEDPNMSPEKQEADQGDANGKGGGGQGMGGEVTLGTYVFKEQTAILKL